MQQTFIFTAKLNYGFDYSNNKKSTYKSVGLKLQPYYAEN